MITYMIQGSYDHFDSSGKHGRLTASSLQLMTGGLLLHAAAWRPREAPSASWHQCPHPCVYRRWLLRATAGNASASRAMCDEADSFAECCCPADAAGPQDVLVLGGRPTHDTSVQYGPFVGGSMADIPAAQRDFNAGRMGALAPDGSPSPRTAWV
ncbi:hypothetical protein V8C86DRAFT_2444144 [Haematococcus lacustris]